MKDLDRIFEEVKYVADHTRHRQEGPRLGLAWNKLVALDLGQIATMSERSGGSAETLA